MKRTLGNLVSSVLKPMQGEFMASGLTYVRQASWHPPVYFSFDSYPKELRSMEHWAASAGNGDTPAAWVYPSAIELCGAGFLQLMRWKQVEPTQGSYDFSTLITALTYMQTNKPTKKVMVRLRDKSYSRTNASYALDTARNLPDYLSANAYEVYASGSAVGFGPKLWETAVKDRYIALLNALYTAVQGYTVFGGIIFDESTLSMSFPAPVDFNLNAYLANRKAILLHAKSLFGDVIQPCNFVENSDSNANTFSTQESEFVNWLYDNGVSVALVDTCPTTSSFMYSMHTALSQSPARSVDAIIDAGAVYPRTDMSAGVALANVTANFNDIKQWLLRYENIRRVFWPISNDNTYTALVSTLS